MRSRALHQVAYMLVSGTAALSCGLADVFRSDGPEAVTMTYQGPTDVRRDSTVPFTVIVQAGGTRLSQPRLRITTSNDSVLGLTAGRDSLIGRRVGNETLTIRLESSLYADTAAAPRLAQAIGVRP